MSKRKPRSTALPCLHLKKPGLPELHYWPKVAVMVGDEVVVADALLCAQEKGLKEWFLVEIDEGGVVTPESRRRERLLDMKTIRLSDEHLFRLDFMDVFIDMVRQQMGLAA